MKSIIIVSIALIISFIYSCKTSTEPDDKYRGITETDMNGKFIGNIDSTDWSPSSYDEVYLGDGFWIYPNSKIYLCANDIGQNIQTELNLYNFSKSSISATCLINDPFICEQENIILKSYELKKIIVKYNVSDSLSYLESLHFNFSNNDKYSVPIKVTYSGIHALTRVPLTFSFLPAFPNPSSGLMIFKFTIPKSESVKLYLKENSGSIIKTIIDNETLPAGTHEILYNLKEKNIKPGIYRAYLKTENFSEVGDIQIIE